MESDLYQPIQLSYSKRGSRLWRNNVGAVHTADGRFLRFGLANESAGVNKEIKSSDLIGITPVIITQEMVGQTVGVFTSIEVKRIGWSYTGSDREKAQNKWIELIRKLGGIAGFTNNSEGGIVK